jgi:hypothetical protein
MICPMPAGKDEADTRRRGGVHKRTFEVSDSLVRPTEKGPS